MGRNFQKSIFEKKNLQNVDKFNVSFATISQNRDKFVIFGKYMDPTLGQNDMLLINLGWVLSSVNDAAVMQAIPFKCRYAPFTWISFPQNYNDLAH